MAIERSLEYRKRWFFRLLLWVILIIKDAQFKSFNKFLRNINLLQSCMHMKMLVQFIYLILNFKEKIKIYFIN